MVYLKIVLGVLKKMLLALLGERLVAYVAFSVLEYLATLSKTNIDDEVVSRWKKEYYTPTSVKSSDPSQ